VITDVEGLRVGHWTDPVARTGCTVVLFPEGTVASGEVRGGAPATRETDLLAPTKAVARIDALLLTGGSAFGLAAADGVMRFCEERGMGVPTPAGAVPIVVGFGLFDLPVGDPSVRPGAAEGYAACEAAVAGDVALGSVGAGTGATVGSATPDGPREPGGLATATARHGDLVVSTLVVVNAFGAVGVDDTPAPLREGRLLGNTTIGLVATNARLDKIGCHLLAQSAHDGLARAVFPAHTRYDGDAFVAAATGTAVPQASPDAPPDLDTLRALATHTVTRSILSLRPA
jgi:L-aminopeptidase/D-esterase-like protein